MISAIDVALLALILAQQVFYMRQIQKLVDKLMSRTYNEYVGATKPPPPRIQIPTAPPEDLRPLQEFSLGV